MLKVPLKLSLHSPILTSNHVATSNFTLIQPGYGIALRSTRIIRTSTKTLIQFLGFQHRDTPAVSTQNLIVEYSHLILRVKKCNIWHYASEDEGGRTYNRTYYYPRSHEFIHTSTQFFCGAGAFEDIVVRPSSESSLHIN